MEYGKAAKMMGRAAKISYNLIETISINSTNPAFQSARFRRALISYRRFGLRPLRQTGWTLKDALYFARNSYFIHEAVKKCAE